MVMGMVRYRTKRETSYTVDARMWGLSKLPNKSSTFAKTQKPLSRVVSRETKSQSTENRGKFFIFRHSNIRSE